MIRQGSKWTQKPPLGYGLDLSHPLAASGLKALWLFNEGSGKTICDLSGNTRNGTFIGSPAWQSGRAGWQVGGFTSLNYMTADAVATKITWNYPFWAAIVASNSSTSADGEPLCLGKSSSSSASEFIIDYNYPGTSVSYYLTNDAGTNVTVSGPSLNDGLIHFVACVSYKSNDHRILVDGVQAASSSTTVATPFAWDQLSFGVFRAGGSVGSVFGGSLIWAALGQGAVPDFARLYAEFWAPYMTPTARRWYAPVAAAGTRLFRPATLTMGSGGPFYQTPANG